MARALITLKGYRYRIRGLDGEGSCHGPTASKARYDVLLNARDSFPDLKFIDISVWRAPEHDIEFPALPDVAIQLDEKDRKVVVHAFGGGSHVPPYDWGYRDYYNTDSPDDERLTRLVSLGVFIGPHVGAAGWSGAYFYLTDAGKTLARSLIGQREAE